VTDDRWDIHDAQWRDPAQIAGAWEASGTVDGELLRHRVDGPFWELLGELGVTLLVGREYEHLLMSLAPGGRIGWLRMPHPSGIAVDLERERVHVAATRNPNQLVELTPLDAPGRPLVPARIRFLPGRLYLHDLAMVGGVLHGNAVGLDAVVRLGYDESPWRPVWWPRGAGGRDGNHLQLNSIAAGPDLERSYFSASAEAPGDRRPGDPDWPVDGRGVIFSGATREPCCRGLTRPHSARLHDGSVWVDNSGYGEVGWVDDGRFTAHARLPGWTRGLCVLGTTAFVATSRVIPRFHRYAPGLDVERSICAVHAVDLPTGTTMASIVWPAGNQIFAVEAIPAALSVGFPFRAEGESDAVRALFSTFKEPHQHE